MEKIRFKTTINQLDQPFNIELIDQIECRDICKKGFTQCEYWGDDIDRETGEEYHFGLLTRHVDFYLYHNRLEIQSGEPLSITELKPHCDSDRYFAVRSISEKMIFTYPETIKRFFPVSRIIS